MALVRIPASLREYCGGEAVVTLPGDRLGALLEALGRTYPECGHRLWDSDMHLRPFVRLYLNDLPSCVCNHTELALEEDDVVSILPAVCGG
jgi:molybdopterin converting factor small subunit